MHETTTVVVQITLLTVHCTWSEINVNCQVSLPSSKAFAHCTAATKNLQEEKNAEADLLNCGIRAYIFNNYQLFRVPSFSLNQFVLELIRDIGLMWVFHEIKRATSTFLL